MPASAPVGGISNSDAIGNPPNVWKSRKSIIDSDQPSLIDLGAYVKKDTVFGPPGANSIWLCYQA